jgi:hypothetical protein
MPKLATSLPILDELKQLFKTLDKRGVELLGPEEKKELELFSEQSIQRLKNLIKSKEK